MEVLKEKIENLASLKPEALQEIIHGMYQGRRPYPTSIARRDGSSSNEE